MNAELPSRRTVLACVATLVLASSPFAASAQVSGAYMPLAIMLSPVDACTAQFPELVPPMDAAFAVFASRNAKHFDAPTWRELARTTHGMNAPMTRAQCDKMVDALPDLPGDRLLDQFASTQACGPRYEAAQARLGEQRPTFGLALEPMDPVVSKVLSGSTAEAGGLRVGDRILAVQGNKIVSSCDAGLALMTATSDLDVEVERNDGSASTLHLSMPALAPAAD